MSHLSKWIMRPKIGDSKSPTLWPSSPAALKKTGEIYGSCLRQIYLQYIIQYYNFKKNNSYELNNLKEIAEEAKKSLVPFDKYQMWLFDSAERYEEHIIENAKEAGIYVSSQTPIYLDKYKLSGKIDLIAYNPLNGKNIITEVKSVYSFGGDEVLGKNFNRFNNFSGKPRTKNLMQTALYAWHFSNENYENAHIIYGDRGSGKYSEYEIRISENTSISYRCIDPVITEWTVVDYNIDDILRAYEHILNCIQHNILPTRSFDLQFSLEKIHKAIEDEFNIIELNNEEQPINVFSSLSEFIKTGKEKKNRKIGVEEKKHIINTSITEATAIQYTKYLDRKTNGGRLVKAPTEGSWECIRCSFRNFCYNEDKTPKHY